MSNVTETGIVFTETVTEEEHMQVGMVLGRIEQGMPWAIGDWWNACQWGDRESKCAEVGINYHTARIYGQIAAVFKKDIRISFSSDRKPLSFAVYREAMRLEDAARIPFIETARAQDWKMRKARLEVDKIQGKEPGKVAREAESLPKEMGARIEALIQRAPKFKRELRGIAKDIHEAMSKQYSADVASAIHEEMKEERAEVQQLKARAAEYERKAKEEIKNAIKLKAGAAAFISQDEVRLVLSCLHTDREAPVERKNEAFHIVTRMRNELRAAQKIR